MTTLFIADLHLSPERPAVTGAFLAFLRERAAAADALYILGDLFEAWLGDDDPSPQAREVVLALRGLSDGGTQLFFQHGNRDFLVGKRFSHETGAQLLPDVSLAKIYGKPVLVMHGDTLCLGDEDYQKFRRKVRRPLTKWLLTHLPLKKRIQIAADWRAKSMASNSNKADHIMDVDPVEVLRLMRVYGVTTMIHGHTHRPAVHELNLDGGPAQRIVLGDWGSRGWTVEAHAGRLSLSSFAIEAVKN